ncbi:MAG: hypothetical protein ACE5KT_04950 [Methanosarcinales archaeon]
MEISLEKVYEDLEVLKRRVNYLESIVLTKEDIEAIEDFMRRKKSGELEVISLNDAMKELGINESELRQEISKETEKARQKDQNKNSC